jgi:hypothetical protein
MQKARHVHSQFFCNREFFSEFKICSLAGVYLIGKKRNSVHLRQKMEICICQFYMLSKKFVIPILYSVQFIGCILNCAL